jgi:murein DD-endopeptidase MepM/ murein hydrolase activator NlpD
VFSGSTQKRKISTTKNNYPSTIYKNEIDSVALNDSLLQHSLTEMDKYISFSNYDSANLNLSNTENEKTSALDMKLYRKVFSLEANFLQRAKNFKDLFPIISNMKSYSPNFKFVPAIMPCKPSTYRRLSSPFGYRVHPISKSVKLHTGLDISAAEGTNAYATADGVVIFSRYNGGYGNEITIKHAFGFTTLYGHLKQRFAQVGQFVKRGSIIGLVGSTGYSTGPHLHYEVNKNGAKIDPIQFTKFALAIFFNDLKK